MKIEGKPARQVINDDQHTPLLMGVPSQLHLQTQDRPRLSLPPLLPKSRTGICTISRIGAGYLLSPPRSQCRICSESLSNATDVQPIPPIRESVLPQASLA